MRKRCFLYLFLFAMSLSACAKRSVPVFADAGELAGALYGEASLDTDAIYCERLKDTDSYLFGMTVTAFGDAVEDAVCWRKTIDSDGELLYALKLRSEEDARALAKCFYEHYEFAPCDAAQKLAVAASGDYVIVFKSALGEVDAAVEAFRTLMNGGLRYEKEMYNR
jgi:hypothetical protein